MPIPKPKTDEQHDAYIERCHKAMADEFTDSKQRHAVCETTWTDHHKKKDSAMSPPTKWLRANFAAAPRSVDRQAKVLRGMLLAQEGPFKSQGRGEFDRTAIETIVRLGNATPRGLASNFTHATVSDDGLGKALGRVRNLTLDTAKDPRTGQTVSAVRGDLHLNPTALKPPPGGGTPYGEYVMDLTESDPGLISSSLVLEADETFRLNENGSALTDEDDNPLPPLWIVKKLHGSDVVRVGDAVHDDLLSTEELTKALSVGITPDLQKVLRFDRVAMLGAQLLDGMFHGSDRAVVENRCSAWLARYLDGRFGEPTLTPTPELNKRALQLDRIALRLRELTEAK